MNGLPKLPLAIPPDSRPYSELMERIRVAEEFGVDQVWLQQLPDGRDLGVLAAAYFGQTTTIQIGSAVLPVYLRHPASAAQLAASLGELSGGRFALGLGLSHPFVNEFMLGVEQGPALGVMREYVTIVRQLLDNGRSDVAGKHFTARVSYTPPRPEYTPIWLAGLRRQMIRLAVEIGDGLVLWMCSARYVREHVAPTVREACRDFGRDPDTFPIVALIPTYLDADVDEGVRTVGEYLNAYAMMPYYRRILETSGLGELTPAGELQPAAIRELSLLGDYSQVRDTVSEWRAAGCIPAPMPMHYDRQHLTETLRAVHDG